MKRPVSKRGDMDSYRTAGHALVIILLAQALVVGLPNAGQADDPVIDSTQLSLEELMDMRIATVVSASRHEQRVTEAPASVTVITSDEIRKYGYRTLADIMRSIPGLYVSYDRNYNYLGVRGFSRPGDYNSRVLLLIDGHRLNDNIYDSATIGTEFPLDIDLIDHIEFTRGPGSSLYGSNAFFGMVNIFTRKAPDVARELSVSAEGDETWKGRGSYGARYDSGLELLLSGSLSYGNGQRNIYYPEYSQDPNGPVYANNDYDTAKSFYSRFSLGDVTLSGLYQTREKGIPTGSYGTVFNSKPNYTSDDRGYVDLSYRRTIGDTGSIFARVFYDAYVYEGKYTYDKSGGLPYVVNQDMANGRWWGAEAFASFSPLQDHHLSFGGEFKGNLAMAQSNFDVSPYQGFLDDNHHATNWGLFVQDEYRIFQPLLLSAGIRYDYYDRFDSINPRASLIYQPVSTTTFKLIYGEAFRAPNMYERYYNDGGTTSIANPNLKPEKIRTYEAVWEQYYGTAYNTSVSAYHSRIDNLISQTTEPLNGLIVFRNVEKIDATGIELSLQSKWESGLQGKISYALQEATLAGSGTRLYNSPRNLVKANVSIPLLNPVLFLSPELHYTSPRQTLAGNWTKDVVFANVTLFCHDLVKGMDASASIYNLFDTSYGDPGGGEHLQDTIRQDGINFRLKLTYRF
ncbi:MAG: TonB-dependent receptor [Pelobacteraceae bacterium]